ncbi:MAG: cyclic-di-AMP receptor [Anaerolineaceae bacterium]|jgi:uncharacterized protein YaaQ
MKLIIAIIPDEENDRISNQLTANEFRVTCIASTGGFLRSGRSTLLIGTDESRVEQALEILRTECGQGRPEREKKAVAMVVNVNSFKQL